jgi:HAD superfamily hydrolase (TIGR01509 family)
MANKLKALVFDCDGVLAETERDGHRVAFNRMFADKGLGIEWDGALYKELLKIGGGKERMRHFFDRTSWPAGTSDKDALIKEMHKLKTSHYTQIIESGQLPLRPGVARLVDEAVAAGVKLAVCSTSDEKSVNAVIEKMLGSARKAKFDVILAGDVVSRKKPDPEIYKLALQRLGLRAAECVVVEDNRNGLLAAKGAGMYCVVTTNGYTEDEDFAEADLVVPELGDPPTVRVDLAAIRRIVES